MTSKFLRAFLAVAVLCAISAIAQTGSPAAAPPSAPAPNSGAASTPATPPPALTGTKVGTININGAVFGSNEGQRDMDALSKKFEPKQAELKNQNDELEALKKQMSTQGEKLNEDARASLQKQIEGKQKSFDRSMQDAQEDFQNQSREVFEKILAKMAPMIVKYSSENGYGLILDKSNQWPQSPILMGGDAVDITKQVVDLYNAQSGVPAPAPASATPKPAAQKPATTPAKPAAPKN